MLKFDSVLIFSEDPAKLSEFYKALFQKEPGWNEGGYTGFDAGGSYLMIGPHDKVKGKSQNPERILLNFETEDFEAEVKRVEALGATVIAKPYHPSEANDMMLATFSDPDGNYFQLATPMKM